MTTKKPEDLTLEEVKEQMSLYQRLYYLKTKNSPEHVEARRQTKRRYYLKKKQERDEQRKLEESTSDEPPPIKDMRKYKKDLNDAYIIV